MLAEGKQVSQAEAENANAHQLLPDRFFLEKG